MHKVKISVNAVGRGSVQLDGMNIAASEINLNVTAKGLTEVTMKFIASVDAEVDVMLDKLILEKQELAR